MAVVPRRWMGEVSTSLPHRTLLAAAGLAVAGAAWAVAVGPGPAVALPVLLAAVIVAGAAAARVTGRWRLVRGLIAVGIAAWTSGDVVWALSGAEQSPTASEVLYVLAYAAIVVAVWTSLARRLPRWTPATTLDVAAITLMASAVVIGTSWAVLPPEPGHDTVVRVVYVAADASLLTLVAFAWSVRAAIPGRRSRLVFGSLAALVLFDAAGFVFSDLDGPLRTPIAFGWALALLGLAASGFVPDERVPSRAGRRTFVPAITAAVLAIAILVVDHHVRSPTAVAWLSAAALLVVLARLLQAERAHRRAVEAQAVQARTDAVTGLPNRRALVEDLQAAVDDGRPRVLALFDLNGFKDYNDCFGHLAGDALLARLGERLARHAGSGRAYRMGGDEFCVLSAAGDDDVERVLQRGRAALSEDGPSEASFAVSAAGGAVVVPDEAPAATDALVAADRAMYADKRTSRTSTGHQVARVALQILAERDELLDEHVRGVGELAEAVARRMGAGEADALLTRRCGELHDIGKLAIPRPILDKPGPLDPDELAFVRRHTVIGERILNAAEALRPIASLVRATHERWDGTGYPDGLAGEAIPVPVQAVVVADAWDAMRSERPHHRALSPGEALAELRGARGTQFAPGAVDALVAELREREELGGTRRAHYSTTAKLC